MPSLTIIIEAGDDPTVTDPHDVAEEIVDTFNEMASRNASPQVEFIRAEWGDAITDGGVTDGH